jgi:hypothetical protein
MLGTLFKVIIIAAIVLAITGGLGLVIMAGVAGTHDVKPIPVPKESSIYGLAQEWDYADAFRRPMEFSAYRDIKQVSENAPIKGDGEIHRTTKEVVYAGKLPGMNYQVAYLLDRDSFPPAVEMVTVYRIKDKKGKYFWKVFRRVHRCLAPYMLDRLGSRAP